MTHDIRAARWTEQDSVAAVIAQALQPTPLAAWLVPDEEQRGQVLADVAKIWVEHAFFFGDVYATTDLAAAAVCFRRPQPLPPPANYATRLTTAAGEHATRFRDLDDLIARRQPAHAHYQLACLAVRPAEQKSGRARALLAHLTSRIDRLDLRSWTVTLPDGKPLLARRGYVTTRSTVQASKGVTLHPMSRNPYQRSGTPSPSSRLTNSTTLWPGME